MIGEWLLEVGTKVSIVATITNLSYLNQVMLYVTKTYAHEKFTKSYFHELDTTVLPWLVGTMALDCKLCDEKLVKRPFLSLLMNVMERVKVVEERVINSRVMKVVIKETKKRKSVHTISIGMLSWLIWYVHTISHLIFLKMSWSFRIL